MARRTVTVDLESDVSKFAGPMAVAAKAVDKLDDTVESASRSTVVLDKGVGSVTRGMGPLAAGAKTAARSIDDLGDEMSEAARSANRLDAEMSGLQATIRGLSADYQRTGDRSIFKQIKDAKRDLGTLRSIRREIDGIGAAVLKAGAPAVGGGIGGAGKSALSFQTLPFNPVTAGVIAGGATLAAPGVFAAAGGATLGAAGLGAAGLGIAGAATADPRIGEAFAKMGADLKQRWQDASRGFAEPTLEAIARLDAAVDKIGLEEMLADAAKFMEPLSRGMAGFVSAFGEGFTGLVEDAAPVINMLAAELPRIGRAFKVMFDEIGSGAAGGTKALEDILIFTEGLIITVGRLIHFFSDWYDTAVSARMALLLLADTYIPFVPLVDLFRDFSGDLVGVGMHIGAVGSASTGATPAVEAFTQQSAKLGRSMAQAIIDAGGLKQALDELSGQAVDSIQAELAWQAAIDNATESLKENGRTLDANTPKGRANFEVLLAMRDAANAKAVAVYNETNATKGSAAAQQAALGVYQQGRAQLVATAQAFGYSAAQANALADSIMRIPRTWSSTTTITTRFVTIGTNPGSGVASGRGRATALAEGGIIHTAQQGLVAAGVYRGGTPIVQFAERQTGKEAYIPMRGIPAQRGLALADTAARWHGGRVVNGRAAASSGSEMVHRLVVETADGMALLNTILNHPLGPQRLNRVLASVQGR